ncbi:MAG: hypothetical protein ACK5IC_09095 [Moheibacter sp.]
MIPINIKFQAYIPKSLGKPLISYFENDRRFNPNTLSNYSEFRRNLYAQGGNKNWLPEPGNTISSCYYSTDDTDFHDHHSTHTIRLGFEANFKPEKIGNYSTFDKYSIFGHSTHIDGSKSKSGHQHSDNSHRVEAYFKKEQFYDDKPSGYDTYTGICKPQFTKRSEEKSLKISIRNGISGTYFTFPNSRPQNETTIVDVSASAGYPFTPESITPNVDFELKIELYLDQSLKKVQISVSGWHNDFPAYELIVDGMVVYNYDPSKKGYTGPTPYNLGIVTTNFSKVSWRQLTDFEMHRINFLHKKSKSIYGW